MNFVDTAITLLHVTGQSMAVEDLCELALQREMFDKPGANPLRSMKTRMTVELKKGRKSRLLKNDEDVWRLRAGVKLPKGSEDMVALLTKGKAKLKNTKAAPAKAAVATATAKKVSAKAKVTAKAASEKVVAKAKPKAASKEKKAADKAAVAKPAETESASPPAKKRRSRRKGAPQRAEEVVENAAVEAKPAEQEAEVTPELPAEPPVLLSEEEKALVQIYGESQGTMSATELNEYRDELTKDEDRPMLPEIRAERRPHRHRDRERGRKRRTRSDRPERPERTSREDGRSSRSDNSVSDSSRTDSRSSDGYRNRERSSSRSNPRSSSRSSSLSSSLSNPTGATDIAGAPIPPIHVSNAAGESLVRDARAILLGLPPGQTMPVRQLTQAMLRKGKLSGTPDQLWRMVKGMLLVSEQRRITRGHERIVRYHGKDLFSAEQLPRRSAVDLAAAALNRAAEEYAAAVAGETQSRLSALALPMLERIIHIYLQTTGWTDIQWVRRVENSSYAVATPSGAVEPTMVAVRCGPTEVDRRGVGELRAGVYAKDLVAGLLISPCDLSEEAQVELAKEGSHVGLLCGKDLIRELTAREIGVTWRHIQLPDVDQRFYDAVLS